LTEMQFHIHRHVFSGV